MNDRIKGMILAVVAAASLLVLPGGAQAQRTQKCVTASSPYCEVCYCRYGATGDGAECWVDRGRFGPAGEVCVLCYTFGKCIHGPTPVIGFGF